MISARRLLPLAGLLVLALVPTLVHGYLGYVVPAASLSDASLPASVEGASGRPGPWRDAWVKETYDVESWAQQTYPAPGGGQVTVFVARGYDMKKLYHHPELGVLRGRSFEPLARADVDGHPVHVLRNTDRGDSGVYALVYDGNWVANPYLLQFSSAVTSLWTGRQPLTLVLAYGDVLQDGRPTAFASAVLTKVVQAIP